MITEFISNAGWMLNIFVEELYCCGGISMLCLTRGWKERSTKKEFGLPMIINSMSEMKENRFLQVE